MLQALLTEIYKEKRFFEKTLQPTSLKGVFLGGLQEGELSAYETYFERFPNEKKEAPDALIKKEVIDFIVNSLIVVSNENVDSFLTRLRKGFYRINSFSPTGRALLRQIRFEQQVDLNQNLLGPVASVYSMFDVIFFDNEKALGSTSFDLATTFLHEMGHVNENIQLRPLFDAQHGYVTKEGAGICDKEYLFSSRESFVLGRLFEAEKQAQTFQILSDCLSGTAFLKATFNSLIKSYFDFTTLVVASLLGNKNHQAKPASIDMSLVTYKRKDILNQIKGYLKEPLSLFKKEKREEIAKNAALLSMAGHIKFLVNPVKKKKFPLLLTGLVTLWTFLGYGAMTASPAFILMGLLAGSVCAGFHFADKYYEITRENWCTGYNKNVYCNSRLSKAYEKGSAKKYRLILKAFSHKYQHYLKLKELEKSRTDEGEIEAVFKNQVDYNLLPQDLKEDIYLIAIWFSKFGDEQKKGAIADWWVHEHLKKTKVLCKNNPKISFEKGLEELFLMRLRGNIYDRMLLNMPSKELLNLKTVSLKEAFLNKKQELCPGEKVPQEKKEVLIAKGRRKARAKELYKKGHQR